MDSSRHEQPNGRPARTAEPAARTASAEELAERLLEVLSGASRRVHREMRRNAGDLTVPQFRALRFIERNPGTDLSLLAAHLGMSRSSASALVERLNRAGYVHRSTNPDERRRIRIELEPHGSLAVAHAVASTRDWLALELTTFAPQERQRLAGALDLLARIGTGGRDR